MKVLTVYAHPNPRSFCHAVLEQFTGGLEDAGHTSEVVFIHDHRPKDVVAQWEKVKNADGLAFVAPVFWLHFPAILKGWFERVFAYGDAYALKPDGWRGEVKGRIPLLHHEKALVISTTLFREEDYKGYWEQPMTRIIDDWGLRYPGVKKVEHVYFYRVPVADNETRHSYLERAYTLGKEFALS
jgi:NAD(P)H dehydrogenase (quinone)